MSKCAVYAATRNIYDRLLPPVKSLLCNSDVEKVYFLIEDDVFPYDIPDIIETINVSGQRFFPEDGPNYRCRWSYMILLRAAYCYILEKESRVLSLDVDTIVERDISMLWNWDLEDCYVAGTKEEDKSEDFLYVNAGVMLHNLEKMRDGKADEIINVLNKVFFPYPEQDAFNVYCCEHVGEIPSIFNVSICTQKAQECYIRHFAAEDYSRYSKHPSYKKYAQMTWVEALQGRK